MGISKTEVNQAFTYTTQVPWVEIRTDYQYQVNRCVEKQYSFSSKIVKASEPYYRVFNQMV
jgi:hypothetical protein